MVYLLLGSNLEGGVLPKRFSCERAKREDYISAARVLLGEKLGVSLKCTQIIETKAVGFDGFPFLNQVVAADYHVGSNEDALRLLDICQAIEIELGRPAHEAQFDEKGGRIYTDRVIDIDILKIDNFEIDCSRLTVPHSQVFEREFVGRLLSMPVF